MCNFLSAIVKPNGDILCNPEYTDSHSELAAYHGLPDPDGLTGLARCVRVELIRSESGVIEEYKFHVDENTVPDWWDSDMAVRVECSMRDRLKRLVVKVDLNGHCEVHGVGVIPPEAKTVRLINARVDSIHNVTILSMEDSKVRQIEGCEIVTTMNSNKVQVMKNTVVHDLGHSARILIAEGVTIRGMDGDAFINYLDHKSTIDVINGHAQIRHCYNSQVRRMAWQARLGDVKNSVVDRMEGYCCIEELQDSTVGSMHGHSMIQTIRNAIIGTRGEHTIIQESM